MPITLNHSNINVQYSSDKSYIIETVKSDLYRRNEIVDTIVRNNIQTAPVTPTTFVDSSGNVYAVESYTYSGTANTADYTRVFTKNTTCDILVVGGGGAGGTYIGGGGGAGGVLHITNATIPVGTYNIQVGKGGDGVIGGASGTVAQNGSSSKAFGIEVFGGGYGGVGSWGTSGVRQNGANGGSGGGGGSASSGTAGAGGTVIQPSFTSSVITVNNYTYYGGNGASGITFNNNSFGSAGANGGGGAGGNAPSNTDQYNAGAGADGIAINITGTSYFWGGGGGGGQYGGTYNGKAGNGGKGGGGGGSGSQVADQVGLGGIGGITLGQDGDLEGDGTPTAGNGGSGTGGGGGGCGRTTVSPNAVSGSGGSGIVIIRYLLGTIPTINYLTNEPVITAPIFTETIRTFVHSGGTEAQTTYSITVAQNTICDILVVGGGGGGGKFGGGGGSGAILFANNLLLSAGYYTVKVGKGGAGASGESANGTDGIDTSILINAIEYIAKGGGGGGSRQPSTSSYAGRSGNNGGSGGGGSQSDTTETFGGFSTKNTYTYWESYGNVGGKGKAGGSPWVSGGGGGAGSVGSNWSNTKGGNGGSGINFSSYFGTTVGHNGWFGGGGGGNFYNPGIAGDYGYGNGGNGLFGGGGNGANETTVEVSATDGLPNTGGGGGGGKWDGIGVNGGVGGSGIVIIKFKSNTNAAFSEGTPATTHKRLNFTYVPNYPIIQADTTNLKAWYKFDGNYNDSSSSGFNLTNSGAEIIDGLIEESLSTDGSEFLQTSGINLNGKTYSISFWVKFNTAPTASNSSFFSQGAAQSNGLLLGFLYESVGNNLRFSHYGGGNDLDTTGYNMTNVIGTSWHHYVVTYNNTNRGAEIWFDGVKLNTNISTLTNSFSGSGNFTIARSSMQGGTLNGLMEDFRYYDKILTSAEISQLYNIPSTNQYTLNFPVPTLTDINNNSNIILRGAYDISLSTINSLIIPKEGQYIPKLTTFASDLLSIRYNILNPTNDPIGAQWVYNTSNINVYTLGNVGIGTTNPQYTLDVSGSVNAKSYYLNGRQINEPLSELGLSEGMIAQVRHLTYTQMDVKNNTGWDAINDNLTTGFVIAITPKSNLSKILVNIIVHIGLAASNYSVWWGIKLYRKIGEGDWTEVTGPNGTETGSAAELAGTPVWISYTMYGGDLDYQYKVANVTGTYLDSPNTTSTVYYTAYWNNRLGDNPSAINTIYLNRAENHGDAYRPAPSSSWTASEIWYG